MKCTRQPRSSDEEVWYENKENEKLCKGAEVKRRSNEK